MHINTVVHETWKIKTSVILYFKKFLISPTEGVHLVSNMSAIKSLNPKAEVARASQALAVNISAARGLQDVLKTNLGPKGTMKM